MTTPAHSPLAPSSAYRWIVCPGSVGLEARYPETEESPSAAEGTAAHWAGSEVLLGREPGPVAPNGVVLTDEMIDGAQMWVDDVLSIGAPATELQVEQRVTMPRIHTNAFGTPDTWLYVPQAGTVYVWDFKFGHGVVEHFENWQLIAYVCGILDLLGIDGRNDQELWVDLRVVQPRAYHLEGRVRTWRVRVSDLRGYFNRLHLAAAEAMGPRPTTRSGSHCLHCQAAPHCETLRKTIGSAADWLGGSAPEELDATAAAYELDLLENIATLVKARKQGREADVEARLKRGEGVPGWTLESSSGAPAWIKGEEEMVMVMGDMYGLDLRKAAAPITPTQAIKEAKKKGVDASVISAYSVKPQGALKLARDTQLMARIQSEFGINVEK